MPIRWKLKTYLSNKHGIFSATALQKRIVKRTGVLISLQNLCNYLNEKPKMIRLETMELICTALDCKLDAFCSIEPSSPKPPNTTRKLSFKNTPTAKRAVKNFPNPDDYST